jgi:hypothetical protein
MPKFGMREQHIRHLGRAGYLKVRWAVVAQNPEN